MVGVWIFLTGLPVRGDLDGHMTQAIIRALVRGPVQGDLAGVEDRQGPADHRRLPAERDLWAHKTIIFDAFTRRNL